MRRRANLGAQPGHRRIPFVSFRSGSSFLLCCFTDLHRGRMSYSRCSMFGPSVRALSGSPPVPDLLCPLLTSACASRHLRVAVAQGTHADLPGYCEPTFTLMPVGSTPLCSVQVLGFADNGLLASALPSASSRFAVARDTLAVRLTVPLAGSVEDFHLRVSAPCRAHHKKAPDLRQGLDAGSRYAGAC